MRLSVFIARQSSPQLIIDFKKIYSNFLPNESLTEQAIKQSLLDSSSPIFVTMFNERHIGAVKVTFDARKATLSQLTIREVTRRRGIGKNLLKQIETHLAAEGINEIQYNLQEVAQNELAATQLFLTDSGYYIENTSAHKKI